MEFSDLMRYTHAKGEAVSQKVGPGDRVVRGDMPLEQLSEASGLSVEYLRNLEAGDVQKVRKKELRRLGKALQMPAPCIKMMGLDPADVPDKVLSELADSVQKAIKAVCFARQERTASTWTAERGRPHQKAKKKKASRNDREDHLWLVVVLVVKMERVAYNTLCSQNYDKHTTARI